MSIKNADRLLAQLQDDPTPEPKDDGGVLPNVESVRQNRATAQQSPLSERMLVTFTAEQKQWLDDHSLSGNAIVRALVDLAAKGELDNTLITATAEADQTARRSRQHLSR